MRARFLVLLLLGIVAAVTPQSAMGGTDADGDGVTIGEGDCDDTNPAIKPGAAEVCDGLDNDCDLMVDESIPEIGSPCTLGCGSDGIFVCGGEGGLVCATGQPPGELCGAPLDVDGDGFVLPLTDSLLLLRWAFGFTGNTLITNALDPDCTRCTADEIVDHIEEVLLAVP